MIITDYSLKHGVTFTTEDGTSKHTYTDMGLYPKDKGFPDPPGVQTEYISIPGMDGKMDASQALDGLVHYEDRDFTQDFYIVDKETDWHTVYSEVLNFLHGQYMMIVFDDDPNWYYVGRMSVGDPKPNADGYIVVPLKYITRPYKYSTIDSLSDDWLWDPFDFETGVIRGYKDIIIEGTETVSIVGSVMPVVPTITVQSENGDGMTCTYNGTTYTLVDGENKIPSMVIQSGAYDMVFTGIGTVSIYFREGSL